ncbi:hypothetical protein [Thalassotalea atypica]|uniref:hypothetical protein n=1 Tax=Thalassotalea atypica TaxID=2054316 RepID=UPI0025743A3B|nr:hypothetical protein [Thalassotalea atypica]
MTQKGILDSPYPHSASTPKAKSTKNLIVEFNLVGLYRKIQATLTTGWVPVVLKVLTLITIIFYSLYTLKEVKQETQQTNQYITHPKIGDIYFLDYRLLVKALRPEQRFRLAKLVDITGNVLTFRYGNLYYTSQHAIEQSIHFGQLRYGKYFEPKRYDFSHETVKSMAKQEAIYMVKRPIRDQLFGSFVSPARVKQKSQLNLPGRRENLEGLEWLKVKHREDNLHLAFDAFERSANLNFAPGQVNLAQMYLTDSPAVNSREQALFWLMKASLQSHKPAILKYVIVCQQVASCSEVAFYQELINAGVSIKVRALSNKITIDQ